MSESTEAEVNNLVEKFLGRAPPPATTELIKSVHRDEVLSRLASILDAAFKKTVEQKRNIQAQQRWFTICGYLAQVMARLVRDLEYEKLRADMDDLKRKFAARYVKSPRGLDPPPRNEPTT